MARALKSGDWILVAAEQARACRQLHGVQSAVGGADVPFTPGTFAFLTFQFWNGLADQMFARAGSASGGRLDIGQKALGSHVRDVVDTFTFQGSDLFLSDTPRIVARDSGDTVVRQSAARIDQALRVMLDAMAKGSDPGTRNARGLLCLDAVNAPRYWESVATIGREYAFLSSSIAITVEDFWTAAAEGAKEGLHAVGVAAGKALSAAGEGLGSAVAGFFGGLGIVDSVLLIGGAVYVGRKVL